MAETAEKIKITDAALAFIKPKYKKFKVGAEVEWKVFHEGSTVPGAAGPDLPQDVKEMMEELKLAGVVLRNGGRYYKTTIVVPEANLEGGGVAPVPKQSRKQKSGVPDQTEEKPKRTPLSIEALEAFVADYKAKIKERSAVNAFKEHDAAISTARAAVASAKTDDEAHGAASRLQTAIMAKRDAQANVGQEVIKEMRRHVETPLEPVLMAMLK